MMISENYFEAWDIIKDVYEPIAKQFKFDLLRAKLILLKASLVILIDDSVECMNIINELCEIESIL